MSRSITAICLFVDRVPHCDQRELWADRQKQNLRTTSCSHREGQCGIQNHRHKQFPCGPLPIAESSTVKIPHLAFLLMSLMLIVAAISDCRRQTVPNRLIYPVILGGLLLWTLADGWTGLGGSFLAMLAALLPMTIVFALGALGGGDVKVMAAVGALSASWSTVLGTAVYGLLLSLILAIGVMIHKKLVRRTAINLLVAITHLAARRKPQLPDDSPRIPLSLTFALGGILAGMEHLLKIDLPWSAWFN